MSLEDIFFTLFPLIAASASSLAFFFILAFVMPSSMASRDFSAFSFPVSSTKAVHTSFSFSPPPVPGTIEPAALAVPSVQFPHVQLLPILEAYVLAPHVHEVAVPPALLEYVGQTRHALPSKYCSVVQLMAISQLKPSYPDVHEHAHDPAVPLTVPPLMQKNVPSLPSFVEFEEAEHAPALSQPLPP